MLSYEMNDEETVRLIKEAMINAGLDETEAERVAKMSQSNIDATRRFEAVEGDLLEVANAYDKLKKGALILGSLLVANFVRDFYEYLQLLQ
jgi:hypothetical protein